ncbi:MAG: hypothetical protein ACI85O_000663 [Saprospiraceae bacterium]|jgi:hypothetical protein
MKTSNKILLGTVGVIVFCMLSMLVYMRANLTTQVFQEDTSEWQTQIRKVDAFQEIIVHTVANVYITQGETKFEMHGTEKTLANIEVKVEDGKLIIKNIEDNSSARSGKMSLYIRTDSLVNLLHTGEGSIESSTKLTFPSLNIKTSGANDASLQLECQNFSYHQTGVGSANITGTTERASYGNTGAGNMDASGFEAKHVDVNGTGIGSFYVHATEQLNINLSGAGSVSYKGNPRIQQNISGIGSVRAL